MMSFKGTFFAFIPALVAIGLALITKEVYSSLFIGIVIGALFITNFSFVGTVEQVVNGGLIKVLSDPYNVGILIFLVVLGILVALMNKSGGSKAFGDWAAKNVKSKTGALLATFALGVIIFVDDYFNCLTVGSVMRPLTDKHKISRAKLAYIIDATAAPVCIIAPISSWAAAVTGFVEGEDGLGLFIKAIPYNYYALLTLAFIIITSILHVDFGKMKKCEMEAENGNLFYGEKVASKDNDIFINDKGTVIDLILPIIILITLCVIGLIYSGGFFKGESFISAFSNADASVGLAIGSLLALIITIIYYMIRRVLNMQQCMSSIVEGFNNMVPAILILTFAWSLKAMTDELDASTFVNNLLSANLANYSLIIPALTYAIAAGVAFATGTSWGTFGILIPIVVTLLKDFDYTLMIISISSAMAGSVFGDHCSPISDTTIMSSAGAECEHILHVETQLPYTITVTLISVICYLIAAIVRNPFIPLIAGIVIMFVFLLSFGHKNTKQQQ